MVHGVNKWSLQVWADYSLKNKLERRWKGKAASIASTSTSIIDDAT
jgi:hypothetical protein